MQFDIRRYDRVVSTMDLARDLAEQGAAEGIIILADEQTGGRGRAGHAWYSPPGQSLYLSAILRPALTPVEAGWITMIAALAVAQTCVDAGKTATLSSTPRIAIKWFNDVMVNARKVSGLLVESSITAERLDFAVLGIGLNVNTDFSSAPPDVRLAATSLRAEIGVAFDRDQIMQHILDRFAERYAPLLRTHHSPAREYARWVTMLGQAVAIDAGNGVVAGQALRIDDDGALIVSTRAGERRVVTGTVLSPR